MSEPARHVEAGLLLFASAILASAAYSYISTEIKKSKMIPSKLQKIDIKEVKAPVQTQDLRRSSSAADGQPLKTAPTRAHLGDDMKGVLIDGASISKIYLHEIRSLRDDFPSANIANDVHNVGGTNEFHPQAYNKIIGKEDIILNDIVRKKSGEAETDAYVRAGPRSTLHFNPPEVRAAIVTCGGLCPGLNNVIREIVHALVYLYKVETIFGIRGGFLGFHEQAGLEPLLLTVENVADIHHQGGTILASARGGFDKEVIINFLIKHKIQQLYIIGGDGTHRGANAIALECIARKLNIAVAGIPKTIDNDVDIIDRSFGFTTSVEAAQAAIMSAKIEARCNVPNGIGIVKLMGRSAGFIAVHATLASGDVDLCLVPEVSIKLDGEDGCLPFLMQRVSEQGHAVVVVAEGAGEELLGKSTATDAGGNRKLPPIGEFLKTKINEYFKSKGLEATVKYIDPSYMIRSVPANASDSLYCMLLSHNAVHGAMAGYTAFSTGLVNNRVVYIPIPRLVATSPRIMDPVGRTWERVLANTRQPNQAPTIDAANCTVNDRTMV